MDLSKIDIYLTTLDQYDQLTAAKTTCFKNLETLRAQICSEFRDELLDKIDYRGHTISAKILTRYNILGGKLSAPEKKLEVLTTLAELGYADKIKFYPTAEINESTLQSIFRKLPTELIESWQEKGLISISDDPRITIKR